MKRCLLLFLLIPYFFLFSVPASSLPETKNSCIQCHEYVGGEMGQPVSQWYGSTHQIEGITCDQCHGGNPDLRLEDLEHRSPEEIRALAKQAMYTQPDFVGAPSGQAQFDLCAECHPDATKMYENSIMGQAYLLKKGGPSCAQCHGPHRNVIPQVPELCKGCHQDTTGFDRLEVMSISEAQVQELARIRIQIAGERVAGKGPLFLHHLESFETGLVSWGMVVLLLLAAIGLYRLVERRK